MRKVIEITPLTLKRLQNYEQVVVNELKGAYKLQWMEMTLERMQEFQEVKQRADRIGAATAYASFLFRVQNSMTPDRMLYGEYFLRNGLLGLLDELKIPVVMVETPEEPSESSVVT